MANPAIRFLSLTFVSVWFVACVGSLHGAIPPQFVSDQQLAKSPIIVVAKWEKSPWTIEPNRNNPLVAKTKLRILRTVKGPKIEQEEIDLKLGWQISWSEEGKDLNSTTSTRLHGDVDDVTVPCLWFLDRAIAVEANSPDHELSIDHYRKVQPLELEAYYLALETEDAEKEIPQLLSADRPVLAERVLQFIAGGQPVWPSSKNAKHFFGPLEKCKVLTAEADRVWRIVRSDVQGLRAQAASVYAQLTGVEGDKNLRTLLSDQNSHLRGTALGILTNHRDLESLSQTEQAIQGIEDDYLLCAIIDEMSEWGNDQNVTALVRLLQSGGDLAFHTEAFVPALRAKKALHKMTGCWFPLNVSKSLEAWKMVDSENIKEKRYSILATQLNETEFPLLAELVGKPIYATEEPDDGIVTVKIQIRNTGVRELTITRSPWTVTTNYPGASEDIGTEVDDGLVDIASNGTHDLQVSVSSSFLNADPRDRELKIYFYCPDGKIRENQWIGTLSVQPSKSWSEDRVERNVEETWDNGNLKAIGKTMNGERFGDWHFFNEEGDRIRIEYRSKGIMTAICAPEHPDNKGAGLRRK